MKRHRQGSGIGDWGLGIGVGCECGNPGCPECIEEASIAKLVHDEFERTTHQARVPSPEIVWWRAQMRARQEAARSAARPILLAQALAAAAVIGLMISIAGRITVPSFSWAPLVRMTTEVSLLPVAIAAACWLVLAPLALYVAFSRD